MLAAAAAPTAGVALVVYFLLSIAILLAYARTRAYPLYLLKMCWVGLTILGFVWLVSMSLADPGAVHGGVRSEFMRNPAGPFASLGGYGQWVRETYRSTPWWMFMAAALLVLWRGMKGHRWSDRDSARRRRFSRSFMIASAAIMFCAILAFDAGSGPTHLRYSGAAYFGALCAAWSVAPLRWKRRWSIVALAGLGAAIAAPVAAGLASFDWSHYAYGPVNYVYAWKTARMGKYMLNSLLVSVLTVGVTSLCASMAAYALARFEFFGKSAVLLGFIGAMVIPAQLYIVPLFLMVQDWQITVGGVTLSFMDSRFALGLIYAASGLPFAIFLLSGFYRTLPGTLREAAAIDGCGEWRMFTDIYFPLALPGMSTAAIFQFLGVWNEYQFALIFLTNDRLKTLPVGLYNLSVSQQYAANWPALFAGITILCLPTFLIFIILQERIVAGLTVGAVKE